METIPHHKSLHKIEHGLLNHIGAGFNGKQGINYPSDSEQYQRHKSKYSMGWVPRLVYFTDYGVLSSNISRSR